MQKLTKKEISEKIMKHQLVVEKLLADPLIRAYRGFLRLNVTDQMDLRQRWLNYYAGCKATPEADMYRKCRDAIRSGNLKLAREIGAKARELLASGFSELPKPSEYDPMVLERSSKVQQFLLSKDIVDSLTGVSVVDALM